MITAAEIAAAVQAMADERTPTWAAARSIPAETAAAQAAALREAAGMIGRWWPELNEGQVAAPAVDYSAAAPAAAPGVAKPAKARA